MMIRLRHFIIWNYGTIPKIDQLINHMGKKEYLMAGYKSWKLYYNSNYA